MEKGRDRPREEKKICCIPTQPRRVMGECLDLKWWLSRCWFSDFLELGGLSTRLAVVPSRMFEFDCNVLSLDEKIVVYDVSIIVFEPMCKFFQAGGV